MLAITVRRLGRAAGQQPAAGRGRRLHRIEIPAMLASRVAACRPRGDIEHEPQQRPQDAPALRRPRAPAAPGLALLAAGLAAGRAGGERPAPPAAAAAAAAAAVRPVDRSTRPPRRRSSPCPPSPRRPAPRWPASPRATSRRRPRRSTRWWRGIPGSGRSMPTARRWRCSQGETETALDAASRPPPRTASPASPGLAADPLFAPLAGDAAAGGARRRRARPPVPAPVRGGLAPVDAGNTAWNPATERLEPRFAFPAEPDGPGAAAGRGQRRREHPGRALAPRPRRRQPRRPLRQPRPRPLAARSGRRIRSSAFVAYAEAARAADLDYGLNERLLFDQPTIGNSSTAITGGALWRSLPRYAMTQADGTGPLRLWQNAAANQLYVYPAHKDYGREERRPLPGQHPLHPGLARLLGLRQAASSSALALILRRLPARHQATAGRRGPAGADRADGLPPLAAERALARGLPQRRRASGGLRGLRDQPRPHGAASPTRSSPTPSRRGSRIRVTAEELGTEGPRLLRPGPLRAALRHPLGDRPRLALASRAAGRCEVSADDTADPNGRAAQPSSGACCRATRSGCGSSPPTTAGSARITLDWHEPVPHLRRQPAHHLAGRHRRLRQQRRARQRPGDHQLVLPARGGAQLRPRPRRRAAHRQHRLRRPPGRPTPTRC